MGTIWDERFSSEGYLYGTEPNEWFREQLGSLAPAMLLLPAEGEGRNAVYAAQLGWEVTAFDQSMVGKEKALALAAQQGVLIDYQLGDFENLALRNKQFDAIAFLYAHFPAAIRARLNADIISLLKPGGVVIFEAFAKEQLDYQKIHHSGGPQDEAMLYSEEEVKREFEGLLFHVLGAYEVTLNEGRGHVGKAKVIRFVGMKS